MSEEDGITSADWAEIQHAVNKELDSVRREGERNQSISHRTLVQNWEALAVKVRRHRRAAREEPKA